MSWEEGGSILRGCPCGTGHYSIITRSDDWNRFDESWHMQCPQCAVNYGLYRYTSNRKGLVSARLGWLPRAALQEFEASESELVQAKTELTSHAVAQYGVGWIAHFAGKAKKAIWRDLTDDGARYPSLGTFYAHVRQSGMERVLKDYFDYDNLATVVRVLRLAGTELQTRIDQVAELVHRLEEQHTNARERAFV